ncbi:hypothetical protein E8E12_011144 [Didymella heteroderae]|uniref:Uncharacterized protein n=1 Tax=Didymella heteroderae TaxID=1769908 RepID=A0A9P4WZC7_9PLEO|nr:hypothetical protein E8E12_011144 [Didymella heteroderae]
MDNSHHPDTPAPKKPRRPSFACNSKTCAVQHYSQSTMKQSQILTPPLTPPHSPRSSISTPTRKTPRKERITCKVHFDLHMSINQSSFTTGAADMSESSLWTLPGSSCFGSDIGTVTPSGTINTENRWSRLLQKAALSNRDRHRAHLEGDGWAFVGGRYSDELQELSDESAESVDEEFDVVVLARESIGC